MLLQSEIYSSYRLKQKSAYSILEKRFLKNKQTKKTKLHNMSSQTFFVLEHYSYHDFNYGPILSMGLL